MIAIGDVHGCYNTLMALLQKLPKDEEICFLGDLIDRGPKSREVVEYVKNSGHRIVIGNHEQMMIQGLADLAENPDSCWIYEGWVEEGGDATVENYEGHEEQLKEHIEWMKTLPMYLTFEYKNHKDLLLSHAPSVYYIDKMFECQEKLKQPWDSMSQTDRDLLNMNLNSYYNWLTWSRSIPYKGSDKYFGISGHNVWNTMVYADEETGCVVNDAYASIDTGACFFGEPYGKLTAIQYPSMKIYQQELIDLV